jgi:hypothetical protein
MAILEELGYLERSYLSDPYLSGGIYWSEGMQVEMKIAGFPDVNGQQAKMQILDSTDINGQQAEMKIGDVDFNGQQAEMKITDATDVNGLQADMKVQSKDFNGQQVEGKIVSPDDDRFQGIQAEMQAAGEKLIGQQAEMIALSEPPLGLQAEMQAFGSDPRGMQAKIFPLAHYSCGYLTEPYLVRDYFVTCMRATQGMQIRAQIISPDDDRFQGSQVELKIETSKSTSMQVLMKIVGHPNPVGMQANMSRVERIGSQATMVLYNLTQLRILCDFASRGTEALGGNNWTSVEAIRAGDFSPNNVNTDIVEERTETDGITALWQLRCDTGIAQGAFVDTCAILNHNFTKSARVEFQGTNDATYSTIGFTAVMETELENMYYIAETLPTESFRYWRFIIQDPTNSEPNLSIGTIIFGASQIFSTSECFDNPLSFGKTHYKDSVQTEGFTNVSNDRATRKNLTLNFSDLDYNGSNYTLLQNYMTESKTDIKCLIIPRPTKPSTFAVFSKLVELPQEEHRATADDNHYVSLTLSWDESQ